MKIDRRSFLGLGLGAAAGIALSPVGVKLTDDSSIWTQNWPWTPVPEDGEITYDRSVCSLCPGACGISVRKINGRPVKIEGLDDHPINNGGACLHGIAGLQYLYDPARIKTPLKKNGNKFEKISWDEAISLVAGKLGEIRESGTPESLGLISGADNGSMAQLFRRFMDAFGSPNTYTMPSLESNLALTAAALHSADRSLGFDIDHSDFILSFGAAIIEGWGSPVACIQANASRHERKAKLVQVDYRLSNTANAADKIIAVKPGTEADLALGLCAVLLAKTKIAKDSLSGDVNKLAFSAMLEKEYTSDKVEAITGVKAADVEALAMAFIKAKAPVAVPGKGRGDVGQSLREFAAVQALNALAGRLNKEGGVFVMWPAGYLKFPENVMDDTAEQGAGKAKLAGSVTELVDKLEKDGGLSALFIYNANPCYALNNTEKVKAAMDKVGFKVSFSSFMDETALKSDVILPASIFLERLEDVVSGAGLAKTVVGLCRPMVKPVFDTKHPGDTLILLAQAMGDSIAEGFSWDSYEACLEEVTGDIWDTLSDDGYVVIDDKPPVGTPVTDFTFLSSAPKIDVPMGEGDFTLVPVDKMRLAGGSMISSPFAVKTVSDTVLSGKYSVVEINPATAGALKDGDVAVLKTAMGTVKVKIGLNEGIMAGVIGMPRGLGHTFNNPYVAGKGVNVNDLIGPVIEPGSGLDAAFGIKATLSKA
ncbi:molybdopterin oxidoreductase [Desulfobacter hydrogenophilus]|uniref:Molybdopterin oxidoreductase n=1 Tax=Desulfobacter hydrogenophilus TaxID=2291 RepID=A0A328FCT9_9BACT|nr:menaquinone reductase molybdopterin-binding-like subunit QrcB [Desulfobacter hydrogenophilus]NDY70492.1 molybdopterin-dependent oxidoreductase [Desulfobacter hydrogenophilus]QBH13869.1 molybdopterin oxidoreductase [Desulfobacter hydrogenophilus]RAM02099.1 molybdopterin oxidoreductase [Desulfobacter hydrogenophilus]